MAKGKFSNRKYIIEKIGASKTKNKGISTNMDAEKLVHSYIASGNEKMVMPHWKSVCQFLIQN